MKIHNSKILITGSNRGIGLGLAQEMAKRKAHLHLQMRSEVPQLSDQLLKLGAASVKIWIVDLAERKQIDNWILDLQQEQIDILVDNAGQLTGGLLEKQEIDEIYSMFQVNVNALVHLTHGLIPGMVQRKKGKIINNSSVSAIMHFPCASTYAASKAAILAFSNCLQIELDGTGVSTLCLITPGIQTRVFNDIEKNMANTLKYPRIQSRQEEYAVKICTAVEDDLVTLSPSGLTGVGLAVAKYFPTFFRRTASARFHR